MSAITTMEAPCWVLIDSRDGREYESADGVQHFDGPTDAMDGARRDSWDEDLVHLDARQRAKPCVVIACSCCGYVFDEEEWRCHFDDEAEAVKIVRGADWAWSEDGTALCTGCGGEDHGACLAHEEATADV